MAQSLLLPPGLTLSVTATGAGTLSRLANTPGDGGEIDSFALDAEASETVGPFSTQTRWSFPSTWTYVAASASKVYNEGDDEGAPVRNIRVRRTAAELNAGATLLPAVLGKAYRLVDFTAIAIGGNAATATSVDIAGTRTSAVLLAVIAVAALTQSAAVKPNSGNVTLLADGASFTPLDEDTAITAASAGDDLATATHVDFLLTYVLS